MGTVETESDEMLTLVECGHGWVRVPTVRYGFLQVPAVYRRQLFVRQPLSPCRIVQCATSICMSQLTSLRKQILRIASIN